MNKVFLDKLPRNKKCVDWGNCVGCELDFQYQNIHGKLKILSYDKESQYVDILYEGNVFTRHTNALINCNLGAIVRKINKKYRLNVGDIINGSKIIAQTTYTKGSRQKAYDIMCMSDGYVNKCVPEYKILKSKRCPVCSGKVVVAGINDVRTTHPDIVKYFKFKEEASVYNAGSDKK